jgi:PAS domain-containing protein
MADATRAAASSIDKALVLDSLDDPVLVIDRCYRIVYMNAAARRRFSPPNATDAPSHCHIVTHGNARPCFESGLNCPVRSVFETGRPARAVHFHAAGANVFVPEEIIATALRGPDGDVEYVIEVARDASELLETKEIVDHMRAELGLLRGMLPTCARCKRIRGADGTWEDIEVYIGNRSAAQFSHGLCPECVTVLYPRLFEPKR